MQFKKYNSIENSFQEDFIKSIIDQGYENLEYVVQEKVHGANLSFITDGTSIQSAKRTEMISKTEEFYNSKTVLEKYSEKLFSLFNTVSSLFNCKTMNVFGELFGGGYPHSEVPKVEGAILVQGGIYYSPGNEFYAFDILLDNQVYLDSNLISSLLKKHGFLYAKPLFKGNFMESLNYPNEFKTTIPGEFNLPELEGNFCEGVVIRPAQTIILRNGDRLMIKNKNEKWTENNKFIDHELLRRILHDEEILSDEANYLCEEIYKLITLNRLNNLISKVGEVNPRKDYGRLLGLYNQDTLSDFMKNYQEKYDALEKQERKGVTKFLNKHASQLITDYFDK